MASIPKRLRTIVALAEEHGWTYDLTTRGHPRLSPPRGKTGPDGRMLAPVTFALTPSDIRADKNAISYLRRCGVPIPR